jgi:hypothetical protein
MEKIVKKKRQPRVGERAASNKNISYKKPQNTSAFVVDKFELNLNPKTARQAVIFSEIIGPPVSRRRRQK